MTDNCDFFVTRGPPFPHPKQCGFSISQPSPPLFFLSHSSKNPSLRPTHWSLSHLLYVSCFNRKIWLEVIEDPKLQASHFPLRWKAWILALLGFRESAIWRSWLVRNTQWCHSEVNTELKRKRKRTEVHDKGSHVYVCFVEACQILWAVHDSFPILLCHPKQSGNHNS